MRIEKMRDDTGIIKAGMAVVVSSGIYSDYRFGQIYIALKDFNYMEEAKKFYMNGLKDRYNKDGKDYLFYPEIEDFEGYLISNEFLGLCNYREIHTGDYEFFNCHEWATEFNRGFIRGAR